jgi:peptidoglycan/LPS O-acetylase OafA/YrhL
MKENCTEITRAMTARYGRWEFLDAVRGLAALLVVIQHTAEPNPFLHAFFFQYLNLGQLGVVTFFLVSGFIIPASIERCGSQVKFWAGRAFRLLPVYWVNFAFVLAAGFICGTLDPVLFVHPYRYLVGNIAMIPGMLRVPCGEGAYWTLQYELIFYSICSLLSAFGVLRRSALWAFIAAIMYLGTNAGAAILLHRALSSEKLGVLTTAFFGALIYRYSQGKVRLPAVLGATGVMAIAVFITSWLRLGAYASHGAGESLSPVCSDCSFLLGFCLFGLLFVLRRRNFPSVVLWLGKISYSVYLWHPLVLRFIPVNIPTVWRILIVVGATVPLAALSYRVIEAPAQLLYKKLRLRSSLPRIEMPRVCARSKTLETFSLRTEI